MPWNSNLTHLRDWYAERYLTVKESRRIVVQAGLDPRFISFDERAITNWFNILDYAEKQSAVDELIDVALIENPTEQSFLLAAKEGVLTGIEGPDIATVVSWQGPVEPDTLEKIIGKRSSFLPIHFLEIGAMKARSVVRIEMADGASGSGFFTSDNLLITNHHVIRTEAEAAAAVVQCNYQQTALQRDAPVEEYRLAPGEGFATSEADDWTAVRVQGNPTEKWGALELKRVKPQKDDWLNIIQHPSGGPKQIALYDNFIAFVDESRVQYLTDTLPGSSGSPCFDSDWNVVALHHSGGWLREPGTKERYYRNQGIHINRVIDGLVQAGLMTE